MNFFRLINDNSNTASFNMASDEALFLLLMQNQTPPTLRFYKWQKPTVSIGYFQKATETVDFDVVKDEDFDFVRRPTGGRAVLHHKEVTFSVTMPTDNMPLWDIFKLIHRAIGTGFEKIGIPAVVMPADRTKVASGGKNRTGACFASPSRFELTLKGKKVAGTAQKQMKEHILIHGSIPIVSTFDMLFKALRFPDEPARQASLEKALSKMTSIYEGTGRIYSFDELSKAMITGLREVLNVDVIPGSYSADELQLIEKIRQEKYSNSNWLFRM